MTAGSTMSTPSTSKMRKSRVMIGMAPLALLAVVLRQPEDVGHEDITVRTLVNGLFTPRGRPIARTLPMGHMQFHLHPQPRKIVHTPTFMAIIYEANHDRRLEGLHRAVHGRRHPAHHGRPGADRVHLQRVQPRDRAHRAVAPIDRGSLPFLPLPWVPNPKVGGSNPADHIRFNRPTTARNPLRRHGRIDGCRVVDVTFILIYIKPVNVHRHGPYV